MEASAIARERAVAKKLPRSYREYGVSLTYYRHWAGYTEAITRQEYLAVTARAP